ncbi:MAG: L-idonate 5-dehydrogenase [Opitutales bacterium]
MKACRLRAAHELELSELPDPVPGPRDAVIRLRAGGICGSDLHYFAEGGVGDFRLREPLVLGHEVAGEVVAVGPEVRTVKPGDRVAVNPNHACGHCRPCLAGRRNLCQNVRFYGSAARFPHVQGAFADFFLAREENCHVLHSEIPYRAAACAEPLAVALHALEQAGPVVGRSVFIAGSGPIGVLLCAAARLGGAARICASDVLDEPLAIARALGATETVNVAAQSDRLETLARGPGTFSVAFEASGHPSGVAAALAVTEPGGTVVQVGMLPPGPTAAPLNKVVAKELRLVGTFRFDREYAMAVAALESGRIDVTPMLTHEFTFAERVLAFATAADKRRAMKVSLRPS